MPAPVAQRAMTLVEGGTGLAFIAPAVGTCWSLHIAALTRVAAFAGFALLYGLAPLQGAGGEPRIVRYGGGAQ
jgi:hypothetical protein